MKYKLYIKLKSQEHLKLVQLLINYTTDNFILRYCNVDEETDLITLSAGFQNQTRIKFLNYAWDCFQHTKSRDLFKELNYFKNTDLDNIFDCILTCLDFLLFGIDNSDDDELMDSKHE